MVETENKQQGDESQISMNEVISRSWEIAVGKMKEKSPDVLIECSQPLKGNLRVRKVKRK